MYFGSDKTNKLLRENMEKHFKELCDWLIRANVDFDYISESLLEKSWCPTETGFKVGAMCYEIIIVSDCKSLRRNTVKALQQFLAKKGRIIFIEDYPRYMDACRSDEVRNIFQECDVIPLEKDILINALKDIPEVKIVYRDGSASYKFISSMRHEEKCKWLFVCRADKTDNCDDIIIQIKGSYRVTIWDAETGNIYPADYQTYHGATQVSYRMYANDSLLLQLTEEPEVTIDELSWFLEEPNVCLLDIAEYSIDGMPFEKEEELLRIDRKVRESLGMTRRSNNDIQPWAKPKVKPVHNLTLKFHLKSESPLSDTCLALENAAHAKITLNGRDINNNRCGYYVDHAIDKVYLGSLKTGVNELMIHVPFGEEYFIENMYLLGAFDVKLQDSQKILTAFSKKNSFGSLTKTGCPFYGGNITYKMKIRMKETTNLAIWIRHFSGACIRVSVDGKNAGLIYKEPYKVLVDQITAGIHEVTLQLYGNRYNTFGALHNTGKNVCLALPGAWEPGDENFSYDYLVKPMGILEPPIFIPGNKALYSQDATIHLHI